MTNKWQCTKCKKLYIKNVKTKKIKIQGENKEVVHPEDVHKLKCCCRIMRNLTKNVYEKEKKIEESGIRKVDNA